MTADDIRTMARECGFELAGVARAEPSPDRARYHEWVDAGFAGEMRYLADYRAGVRDDPRNLLPSAQSIISVGKLYNTPGQPDHAANELGWISRYAWGDDYHQEMRRALEQLESLIRRRTGEPLESRICVDTAPLLERSYARAAGLGWIGKNTCLINQQSGSWFFLGELLLSIPIAPDAPPPDRCGTCTRCIDACPTEAIVPIVCQPPNSTSDGVPTPKGEQTANYVGQTPWSAADPPVGLFAAKAQAPTPYTIDSRLCISYFTIELRTSIPEPLRPSIGNHLFGCDICQDVCPWNRRAPFTDDPAFQPRHFAPPLEKLAAITEQEFRSMFRGTPVTRARYSGFLRNVAVAMGNSRLPAFRQPLEKLAASADPLVAEHARWAIEQLR